VRNNVEIYIADIIFINLCNHLKLIDY
jgi:hypothetical protein